MTERGYLGEVLKELRLERGMSLSRLADVSGVSKGYLSALESGKQKNPSLEKLMALASALGVSITVSRDEPGYIRVSEGSPPCVSVVRSGVPTIREEIEEAKEETYKPGAEAMRVSEVGKWPADYKAPSGGMGEGAVAIGVDLAHGPGKAVTTVWRVQDGKMEMMSPWLTWTPETWRLAIVGDTETWVELETTSDVVGYAAPGGNAADWTALLMMLRAGTPGRASMRLAWHAEMGIFCFRNHREGLATPFRLSRDEAPDVATWLEEELLKLGIKVATPVLDEAEAT
jgi:transcriptional regulator with XRE-family HTH domain